MTHAYDQENAVGHTRALLDEQLALPPKLRSKPMITLDIVKYFYSSILSYLERLPHFHELSLAARRTLIRRNFPTAGTLHSMFVVRETNALDNQAYAIGCSNVYGQENMSELRRYVAQLEPNDTLVKLMLSIIAFAGNASVVRMNNDEELMASSSALSLIHVQHTLVTMFWKYLLYQYGHFEAVRRLNSLTKYVLNILQWTEMECTVEHRNMIDGIVQSSWQSLTLAHQ